MTYLKPRDSVEELAISFVSFLRVKGISTRFLPSEARRQMRTSREMKAHFKADLQRKIREFLERHNLWRASDLERLGQIVLNLPVRQRIFVPCRLISQSDRRAFPRPRSRDIPIELEEVNELTACFGCLFVREGFSRLRDMSAMDDLRTIVVSSLKTLGYLLEEDYAVSIGLSAVPDWCGCPNYFCIARKEGAVRSFHNRHTERQLTLAVVL